MNRNDWLAMFKAAMVVPVGILCLWLAVLLGRCAQAKSTDDGVKMFKVGEPLEVGTTTEMRSLEHEAALLSAENILLTSALECLRSTVSRERCVGVAAAARLLHDERERLYVDEPIYLMRDDDDGMAHTTVQAPLSHVPLENLKPGIAYPTDCIFCDEGRCSCDGVSCFCVPDDNIRIFDDCKKEGDLYWCNDGPLKEKK